MAFIAVGDRAPRFHFALADRCAGFAGRLSGKQAVVLFFYPKDGTAVCTKEACSFRDAYEDFVQAGAVVIGVSSDPVESHQAFASGHRLPFVLLADVEGSLARRSACPRPWGSCRDGSRTSSTRRGLSGTCSARSSQRIGMLRKLWPWCDNSPRVERSPHPLASKEWNRGD